MAPDPDLTQTLEPQMVAFKALTHLYDSWDTNGGPSPSTDDEAREVAKALGAPEPVTDQATLNDIWEMDMQGADLWDIACEHVRALNALHIAECHFCGHEISCHFCGQVKPIHAESRAQYGEPICVQCFNTSLTLDPTNDEDDERNVLPHQGWPNYSGINNLADES